MKGPNLQEKKSMTSGLLHVLYVVNSVSLIAAAGWGFAENDDDWASPLYTKLVIVGVVVYGIISVVYIVLEEFIKPANTFILNGITDNGTIQLVHGLETLCFGIVVALMIASCGIYFTNANRVDCLVTAQAFLILFFLIAILKPFFLNITVARNNNDIYENSVWKQRLTFLATGFASLVPMWFAVDAANGTMKHGAVISVYFVLSGCCSCFLFGLPFTEYFSSNRHLISTGLLAVWMVLVVVIFFVAQFQLSVILVVLIMLHGFVLWNHHCYVQESDNTSTEDYFISGTKVFTFYEKRRRLPAGTFILVVVLNIAVIFLAVWSQTSSINDNSGKAVKVRSTDREAPSFYEDGYAICQNQDFFTLDAIDLAYLTELSYLVDPITREDCGLHEDTAQLQDCLGRYFSDSYVKAALNGMPYSWEVLKIESPSSSNDLTQVAYYSAKSETANLIVVGVRGSTTGRDWLEDVTMFSEIAIVQLFSLMVPMVYVWPKDATAIFVKLLSFSESLALTRGKETIHDSYYDDVDSYVKSLKRDNPTYDIMVLGHSLGAALAQIVGAKNEVRAIGFEPPGIVFSHDKFQISGGIKVIDETAFSIKRDNDMVTWVDKQGTW